MIYALVVLVGGPAVYALGRRHGWRNATRVKSEAAGDRERARLDALREASRWRRTGW